VTYPDPRYHGEGGELSAVLRRVDTPADLHIAPGSSASYLATGATTDGQFGLYRWDMGPEAGGPGPHFHRTISESFYVLSGTVEVFDGTEWTDAREGDFLHVPEGGIHGFRNASVEPASMLLLFVPGAPREDYFETLAAVAAGTRHLSDDEWAAFFARHDTYWT
jgi:mannose-6-phosphate isomerase-like protein (cupin superfamily)